MRGVLVLVLLLIAVTASATDYDTCFHTVPSDGVATLTADLDCSGLEGVLSFAGISVRGLAQLSHLDSHDNLTGVSAWRTKLTDSTLSANGVIDLLSKSKPVMTTTSCETSARLVRMPGGGFMFGAPWGVCAND
jgi:hypothetical protein